MTDRTIPAAVYAQRIACHRERAKRKAIAVMTICTLAALAFVLALTAVAHASSRDAQVQRAVDAYASRHVPHLKIECRGKVCAAYNLSASVIVVVRLRAGSWVVTSGVA